MCEKARATVFDGGVDSANLGKGEWIYVVSYAVNHFTDPGYGSYVPSVTDVPSMMTYLRNTLHVQFIVVKAGSGSAYYPSQASPQFTTSLVNAAHAQNLKIFGYTLSAGSDIAGESAVASYVFNCGADGFILDAEGAWETLTNRQTLAWQLCGSIKTNWPTKFLAHSPLANYSSHSAFPYKEFGYWCDTVMPQVYWVAWGNNASPSVNQYRTPILGIQWMDSNFSTFQNGLSSQGQTPPTYLHPSGASWTNAIKPLAPIGQADTPGATNQTYTDMTNFVNYLNIDPTCVTAGGYKGCLFFRPGLQDVQMLNGIAVTRIGNFNTSPSIISQPSSRTNNAGTSATFSVAASGSTPFSYAWSKDGFFLSDTGGVSGSASATLTVSSVLASQGGNYTVVVGNAYGFEASAAAQLTVIDPFISVQPANQTNAAGTTTAFNVTAVGTAPLLYQWQKNNLNLVDAGNTSGSASNILTLTNLSQSDEASYTVLISNSVRSITSSVATLTVTGPPHFTLQPQSQTVVAGTDVTFSVGANGNGPLGYQWFWTGQPLPNAIGSSLTVSNVQPSVAGNYSVVITNELGTITSTNALLTVNYALNVNVIGSGSVSQNPNQASYTPGSVVTVTAIPDAGASFLNWSGEASGTTNPVTIAMTGNKTIGAEFSTFTPVEDIVIVESRSGGSNYSAYADTNFANSTLKSLASGCSAASIGSRYAMVSNATVTIKPTLANAGKKYLLQVTHGSAASVSTSLMVNAAIQGGSFVNSNGTSSSQIWTAAFQQSSPDTWKTLGKVQLNPGVTQPTITFSTTNTDLSTSSRLVSDAYRLAINSTTTLTASTNTIIYGHSTIFNAKVTGMDGTPSGTVTFFNMFGERIGTSVLDQSGVASLTSYMDDPQDSPLPYTAHYEGDANFSPSTSNVLQLYGLWDHPSLDLHSSTNPSASGAEVTFTVTATGTGIFLPNGWIDFYDGDTLLGSPYMNQSGVAILKTSDLSIGNSPHSITGYFVGDWGFDEGRSAPLLQTVMDPPVITTQPISLTTVGGTNASFNVTASGTAPLSYHWFKNGITPVSGASNVLSFPSLHRNDSGIYTVVVSNLVGAAVSENAFLSVRVPQRFDAPTLLPDGSMLLTASDADGGMLSAADLSNFQVQHSTNFIDWTLVPDTLTVTNGSLRLQVFGTNDVMRFYRIVESW